ncbi:alkaline phosphatase PhoX [Methylococcus sp. ANG]|uniref:PhoX family protein n=1 Tax=Methylococcus sp. ANG TaxID=3231903 RepID=UPI00345B42CC
MLKKRFLATAVGMALAGAAASPVMAAVKGTIPVKSVEFIGMAAPETAEERAAAYTTAKVKVTFKSGGSRVYDLNYNVLFHNTDTIGGVTAGAIYDVTGTPLLDSNGNPMIAETPDANSLIRIPARGGDKLFLVTHFEYDWLDTAGADQYGKQPMTMSLANIEQDGKSGKLSATALRNIDMSAIDGLWIPCAGSLSPWNTHLGSEEYEPDARCQVEGSCASGAIGLEAMERYLAGTKTPNVYNYGVVPEVTVGKNGETRVVGHRTLGRVSRELVQVLPDERTAIQGDDGTYNVLTMFVADRKRDLSAGTLYAAKWIQTSAGNGGEADLAWVRLGHSSNAELEALVASGLTFADIFETAPVNKLADGSYEAPPAGFKQIIAGHNKGLVENLKLKPGMETAAAFLETRRYAAYVGATSEFEKFEGVTVNARDRKVYLAMTRMSSGMEDRPKDPANHIRIPKLLAGAVYQMDLATWKLDSDGHRIDSRYVGTHMKALVLGQDIAKDAAGNTAAVDKIANPDNLKYSEKMRTLFIGEDSSTLHINNFLWAYNVDTGKLSRILSLPAGAESTGLQAIDSLGGYSYIMSNYQHAGDFSSNIDPALKGQLEPLIDKSKAAVGYLGGMPAFK